MKSIFHIFKAAKEKNTDQGQAIPEQTDVLSPDGSKKDISESDKTSNEIVECEKETDTFIEWCRSATRGGIEKIVRNDIFEAYYVFGTDGTGKLVCRYFHRYPEHESEFDLSYSRELSLDDFNRRLLTEVDKGTVTLADYHHCIVNAEALIGFDNVKSISALPLSDDNKEKLLAFCEGLDTLRNKSYRFGGGIFHCEGDSIIGEDTLQIKVRKQVHHDAFSDNVAGVSREPADPAAIDNIWILGIYNRVFERSESCKIFSLKSAWNLNAKTVYLISAENFAGIEGNVLIAVAEADAFSRFGFYSLDFTNK